MGSEIVPLTAEERDEYQRVYRGHTCDRPVCAAAMITRYEATLVAAYDAQTARLAALREWAVAERDEWSGRNADRYWQMTRVVNEIDGAVRAGEATDGD